MAFLKNHLARKIVLTLILVWGGATFFFTNNDSLPLTLLTSAILLISLIYIWTEKSTIFTLILLSFTSAYALNVFMSQLNIPYWLIMLSVIVIFGYLFTYTEQKIGILGNKRLIYLVLFSLIVLEVFLALSYFVISPINQSLIIASISYLFIGYCYTVLAKHVDNNFLTYVIITILVVMLVFMTSTWGALA